MSRSVSTTAREALFAPQTEQVFLPILTISHTDLTSDIRVVCNTEDITSNGDLYTAYPFTIDLPSDSGEEISRVTLTIDNVHRDIITAIRSITSAPTASLSIILADSPDTVEAGPFEFTIKNTRFDAMVVSGELSYENILDQAWPGQNFTPAAFPGLF